MIILSGVLVVLAIALLVTGIVIGNTGTEVVGLDGLSLIYVSIAVSIVSALCLAIGVFLRRKELFGGAATASAAAKTAKPAKTKTKVEDTEEAVIVPAQPVDVPAEAVVFIVSGRKRYHLDSCRQLAGRDKEELTYEEARGEGFTACTACMPDTALAARAAVAESKDTSDAKSDAKSDVTSDATEAKDEPAAESPTPEAAAAAAALADTDPGAEPAETISEAEASVEDAAEADSPAEDAPAETPVAEVPKPAEPDPQENAAEAAEAAEAPEPVESAADKDLSDDDPEPPAVEAQDAKDVDEDPQRENPADVGEEAAEAAPAAAETSAASETPGPSEVADVRILTGTKRYHRPDCALIEDIGDASGDLESLSRDDAKAKGCTPCLVCQPDREPATRE